MPEPYSEPKPPKPPVQPVSTNTALMVIGFILVPFPLALPLCIILWKIVLQWTP